MAAGEGAEAGLQPAMLHVQHSKPGPQAQQDQEQDGHHNGSNVSGSGSLKSWRTPTCQGKMPTREPPL